MPNDHIAEPFRSILNVHEAAGEIERLRTALAEIRDCHLGDCPAASDEMSFAIRHISRMRRMALDALEHIPCRRCTQCEGQEHHWMATCEEFGDPVMICKHCPATREYTDEDDAFPGKHGCPRGCDAETPEQCEREPHCNRV